MTVYRATLADKDGAKQIIEVYNDKLDIVVRDSEQAFQSYFEPDSGLWLAKVDNRVVGCVILRPLPTPGHGEVKRLYVARGYRGQGLSHKLMKALEDYAAQINYEWLYLDTKDDLEAAIKLYERSGYERCERYNKNPQATIFMRKRLAAQHNPSKEQQNS